MSCGRPLCARSSGARGVRARARVRDRALLRWCAGERSRRARAHLLFRLVRVVLHLGRRGAQEDERLFVALLHSPDGRALRRVPERAPPFADLADALHALHRPRDRARRAVAEAAAALELVEHGLVVRIARRGDAHLHPLGVPGFRARRLAAVASVSGALALGAGGAAVVGGAARGRRRRRAARGRHRALHLVLLVLLELAHGHAAEEPRGERHRDVSRPVRRARYLRARAVGSAGVPFWIFTLFGSAGGSFWISKWLGSPDGSGLDLHLAWILRRFVLDLQNVWIFRRYFGSADVFFLTWRARARRWSSDPARRATTYAVVS